MSEPLRIDYLSPLPPVRSGIADYSADLLPALEARCDVRVLRIPGQPISPEMLRRYRPGTLDQAGTDGRLPVYQMGNNTYHQALFETAIEHPGIVVLHDLFLHHLLMERTLARRRFPPYAAELEACHGWIGGAVAEPTRFGAYGDSGLFALPCHRTLLAAQRGVIVHSRWAASYLYEELGDVNLRVVPMPMPLEPEVAEDAIAGLRARLGVPATAPLIGSFGFQTPIKRTQQAVRALAEPGMESAHLLVVGKVAPQLDLDALAAELGVADRVHRTGYLSRQDLAVAMAAADLCLNLRYPTAGETSASLLRLFAMGRPCIVSDYAQFAELPDDVVIKVPLGDDEVGELARRVAACIAEPQRLRSMGAAARLLIRAQHHPPKVAAQLVRALDELRHDSRPRAWRALPSRPPTTRTWGELPGRIEVANLDGWEPGERRPIRIELENRSPAVWLAGRSGAGGVVLQIELRDGDRDVLAERPWVPLPRDLAPGESAAVELELRRPPGPPGEAVALRVEPHVLGARGFSALRGPHWPERPVAPRD